MTVFLWCVIGDMSSISGSEDSSDDEEEDEDTRSAGICALWLVYINLLVIMK